MRADATTSSLLDNAHPPLAYDAQGFKLPIPAGTAHWRILRHTRGRPKPVPGHDMQPARFGLDLTQEDLVEMCGPGTYRIEALDELGRRLECVTTVTIGPDAAAATTPLDSWPGNAPRGYATNDLRIAMETIAQISKAHSESLQTMATAQADWIKTLATTKAIPRNASWPPPAAPVGPPMRQLEDDHDVKPGWLAMIEPAMPMLVTSLLRNVGSFFAKKEQPSERRNASDATHIARVRAKLSPTEQQLFDNVLLDDQVSEGLVGMLVDRSVDDAAALIRQRIGGVKPPKAKQLPSQDLVSAVTELLTAEECAAMKEMNPATRAKIESQLPHISAIEGAALVRTWLGTADGGS